MQCHVLGKERVYNGKLMKFDKCQKKFFPDRSIDFPLKSKNILQKFFDRAVETIVIIQWLCISILSADRIRSGFSNLLFPN